MGLADMIIGHGDDEALLLLDDCDELDVSSVVVDRLLSEDKCLVDQLDCSAAADSDEDRNSLAGTVVGDDEDTDEIDEELLATGALANMDSPCEDRPSLFLKRTDSAYSSFSLRDTISSVSSGAAWMCTCGRNSERRRSRVLSSGEDPVERTGLNVRVTGIESAETNSRFVLRVEDLETSRHWEVRKNTKEMAHFYNQIREICMGQAPVKKEMWGTFRGLRKLRLPKKFLHSRGALCYQRRVVYDSLLRHTAALVSPAPMGPRRRQVVALLHEFLDIPHYCDVSDRDTCTCCFFSNRVNASQLVNEIFSSPHHSINIDCGEFVAALSKKTHEARRTKMGPRQAQTILRTISKKVADMKTVLLNDVTLIQQVGTIRQEMPEDEFDDFIDEIRRAAARFVQKVVIIELEDHVYEALHVLYAEDEERKVLPKMATLSTKRPSYFGVPRHLKPWNDWEDARVELRRIDECSLPIDKLKCILRASSEIFRACRHGPEESSSPSISPAVSTDDFLQILFYVVATSNLTRPMRTVQLLRLMCDQDDLTGEMGYYFTNFEAAVQLVETHTI